MRKLIFLLMIVLVSAVGAVSAQENESYVVQRGDTLTSIATAFDVEADAILLANNIIDPNRLVAGQVLTIPTVALMMPTTHTVGAGETLNDIAIRYNTTIEALVDVNMLSSANNITVGQVLTLPTTSGPASFARSYRIEIGDTLRTIGEQFGVTWQQIASFNNIANPNYVQAGMIITIPPANYVIPTATHVVAGHVAIAPAPQVLVTHPILVHGVYTVRAGDTMFAIASAFGVNVYDIAEANGILNLNHIYVGQRLVIH